VLKIDVEGADFPALKSFDFNTFHPEVVMVEFMDERSMLSYGYTHHDMAAYMQALGYATFVSEWAPIREYAREGAASETRTWLQCGRYPLHHEPAWGNLIFVPESRVGCFEQALEDYVAHLRRTRWLRGLRSLLAAIPGARSLHRLWLRARRLVSR
jgi:hypothetical protein